MTSRFRRSWRPLAGAAALAIGLSSPLDAQERPQLTGFLSAPQTAEDLSLTLDEAVERALEQNLDIAVERLNPATFDLSIAGLRASYRPNLASTVGQNNLVQLPTSQLIGGQRVENQTTTYNFLLSQAVPWRGGSFTLGWNNRRQASTSTFNTFNPQYNATLSAIFTQPLLRGFATDAVRSQLRVTQINRDISEIQLRGTIVSTLAAVRNAYWDLVFAIEALDAARQSLALAEKLVEDNTIRVELGTLAPIDIVEAQAEAANRRLVLTQAEGTRRTAELALKRLIVQGTDDALWSARLNPVDRPVFQPAPVDVEGAVRYALDVRTDLHAGRRSLDASQASLAQLRNLTLPAVDLVGSYSLQGIGGTQFLRQGLGSQITGSIPGGYGDALSAIADRSFPNWTLQLQISYPIGGSPADANYERARVAIQQAQAQIRALELQVATEVTNAALQVETTLGRVEAARVARELSERRLEAETSKFEVGRSTNFFVVQAQRDVADARNVELRAILDYRKALVDFERVQETSLTRAGITVVTAGGGANAGAATANAGAAGGFSGGGAGAGPR